MKSKKFLCAILALLCGTMMTTSLTSCSNDDDDQYVSYVAQNSNPSNMFAAQLAALMNNAIDKELGTVNGVRVVLRNDRKAIEVCDEVAKEFEGNSIFGPIELTVTPTTTDPNDTPDSEVIKTYYFTSNNTSSSTDSSSDDTDDSENSEE